MNSSLIYALGYLALSLYFFSNYKKNKTKYFLWFTLLGAVGFFLEVIHYYLIISNAAQNILLGIEWCIKGFDVFGLIVLIFIAFEYYGKKRN